MVSGKQVSGGIIQENTPLAGSSARALVCAVVGGGLSMYDALQATKEVALTYGTAFRLGVSTISLVMVTIVPSLMNTLLFMNDDILFVFGRLCSESFWRNSYRKMYV